MTIERNSRSRSRYEDFAAGLILIAALIWFHQWSTQEIAGYYADHLPHYDSVGGYTHAYRILNAAHAGSWGEAWHLVNLFSLSQTQALFALVFSPILDKTPQSLQLYNTLCIFAFCASAYAAGRLYLRVSPLRACIMALVIFIPDTLYTWQGGLLDWQRDSSFFCLLGASFFLFFAFVATHDRHIGIFLGVALGVTLISRDSAAPTLLISFIPLYLGWLVLGTKRKVLRAMLRRCVWPALSLAPFIAWFAVFQLFQTIDRLADPFISFAIGGERWASLMSSWWVPYWLIVGESRGLPSGTELSLAWLLALIAAAVFYASLTAPRVLVLLLSGLWISLATVLLLTLVYGLRPLSFPAIKHPFYPTMMLFLAASIGGIAMLPQLSTNWSPPLRWLLKACIAAGSVHAGLLVIEGRIALKTRPAEPALVAAAHDLTALLAAPRGEETAFLWHDGISIDVLHNLAHQRSVTPPRKLIFDLPNGTLADTEIGLPVGIDPAPILSNLRAAVLECARHIVVGTDLSRYADSSKGMFIYEHGQPLVAEVLAEFPEVARFTVGPYQAVVLSNPAARICR